MPAFRKPLGAQKATGKTPSFSLKLFNAVQELKDKDESSNDDESNFNDETDELPSQRDRRLKHEEVARHTENYLERLERLNKEKNELLHEVSCAESVGYQEDSSQLQSYVNSPDVMNKGQMPAEMSGVASPIKNES